MIERDGGPAARATRRSAQPGLGALPGMRRLTTSRRFDGLESHIGRQPLEAVATLLN
jgi:hypothetical protein